MERVVFEVSNRLTIVNNDCLDELNRWDSEIVDVVVTSPPYNIGMKYNEYNDTKSLDEYLAWIYAVALEIRRVMKEGASFFLNIGNTYAHPTIAENVCHDLRKIFHLQNHIIWIKNVSIGDTSHGHFKPVRSKRYLNNCWETIFHFTKTGKVELDRLAVGVPFIDKKNIVRWKANHQDRRCAGNCWFIPYETTSPTVRKFHKDHPAGFPIGLPLRCIKLHGVRDDMLVADPFLGCGSTLQACQILGIRGVGIEIDKHYCETAQLHLNT